MLGCNAIAWIAKSSYRPQQLTAPKMFRPEHAAELFRLFGRWPPYIFLFGKLLGVEREVIEMEVSMLRIAIRHTLLQENAIIKPKNQS